MTRTQNTMHNFTFVLLLIGAVCLHTSCGAQMSEYKELASAGMNGGFEILEQNLPVNWYFYSPRTVRKANFTLHPDSQDVAEGKYAMVFDVTECSDKGGRYSPGLCNEFPVTPGSAYRIRLKVKNSGANIRMTMNAVSAKHSETGTIKELVQSGDGWQEIQMEYKVPSGYARLRFELNVLSGGKVKIDAFTLEPVNVRTLNATSWD